MTGRRPAVSYSHWLHSDARIAIVQRQPAVVSASQPRSSVRRLRSGSAKWSIKWMGKDKAEAHRAASTLPGR